MNNTNSLLRFMSFNIRLSCDSGTEAWDVRKLKLVPLVLSADADCIGFQEVEVDQYQYLVSALSEYGCVGVPRDNGLDKGERVAVFYKKSRFELFDSGDFWLSNTPNVASYGWDAACIRICTYAGLCDKATGKKLYHFNTHLDHVGKTAMVEGARMICNEVMKKQQPAIVTGDFNVNEFSPAYNVMIENGMLDSKYNAAQSCWYGTFHGYNPTEKLKDESPIDYLFYTKNDFLVDEYSVVVNGSVGEYTSDHYPIVVGLKMC